MMNPLRAAHVAALLATCLCSHTASGAAMFAGSVVSYTPGNDTAGSPLILSNTDPTAALGEPTRVTAPDSPFGGPTTPFNASFGPGETVSIGIGGSLTIGFDQPVTDDPNNPFGIDLLVFGNAFLFLDGFPADETTTTSGGLFAEGGGLEVSSDGLTFVPVPGVSADGLFPTLGFSDVTEPFPAAASVPTDFTLPVDPSLTAADFAGLNTSQIVALYAGSGGGLGIDIGALPLTEVSFVRVTNPLGSTAIPEIDGFADVRAVPEPSTLALCLVALGMARARSKRVSSTRGRRRG